MIWSAGVPAAMMTANGRSFRYGFKTVAPNMSERARELVYQMADGTPWPDPAVMEEILAQGDDAVDPLIEVLGRDLHGWPAEAPIHSAIGLLTDLGAVRAIPDLVNILRRYDGDIIDEIGRRLGRLGPPAVDPLCEIIRDRSLKTFQRAQAIDAARIGAGDDLVLRARVSEVLRDELSAYFDAESAPTDEQFVTWLVTGMTDLADPLARDLIRQAFDRDLVDRWIIDEDTVEEFYAKGGDTTRDDNRPWIDWYKEWRQDHLDQNQERAEALLRPREDDLYDWSDAEDDEYESEDEPRVVVPIRRGLERPGRNDPCWCGSGKKYKKCHLASDDANG